MIKLPPLPNINVLQAKLQKKLPLIISLALGLAAMLAANAYIKGREKQLQLMEQRQKKQAQLGRVLVAKEDIPQGDQIEEKMMVLKELPLEGIQPRTTDSPERLIGKVVIAPIDKGEQISLTKLASSVKEIGVGGLSGRTPPGKRAITIPVDVVSSVGGMIRPNDYVDILGAIPDTQEVEGQKVTQYITVPLFQKVLILAVGSDLGGSRAQSAKGEEKTSSSTLTIALSPQEATMAAFVQEQGKLRFILRSPTDPDVSPAQPTSWGTLFAYLFPQSQPSNNLVVETVAEKPAPQVEIYRGTELQVVPLEK